MSNKTIIVGMTGRIESSVAAYLLKKQGYKCIGVGIVFFDQLDSKKGNNPVFSNCHIASLHQVKAVCEKLEIPFYAVKALEEYKAEVTDMAVAARLAGQSFYPCTYCNRLKIDILLEKANLLNADLVATGHYAKIQQNQKTKEFSLLAPNDLLHDQTYSLGLLQQKHLRRLVFPLADLRLKEVEKVAMSLGLDVLNKPEKELCFAPSDDFVSFVEANSPRTLRAHGGIFDYDDDCLLADHEGIHHYYIGQDHVKPASSNKQIDSRYRIVEISLARQTVYVTLNPFPPYDCCLLKQFKIDGKFDTSKPIGAVAKLHERGEKVSCTVYYKNNENVLVQFFSPQDYQAVPGDYVVLYNKDEPGAKVIGGGVLIDVAIFEELDRTYAPKDKLEEMQEKNASAEEGGADKKKKRKEDIFGF